MNHCFGLCSGPASRQPLLPPTLLAPASLTLLSAPPYSPDYSVPLLQSSTQQGVWQRLGALSQLLPSSLLLSALCADPALAAGRLGKLEEVNVIASAEQMLPENTEAASVGTVLPEQIAFRPSLRPAELLEIIPGMVVTQHSGDGKANQYFLRGFNLDHGTDFASYVEGMPVNNVSHGHGQGYTDLNFLIPEMVARMVYKKGPYYASEGDFSSAGSARIAYVEQLDQQQIKVTAGEHNYQRVLLQGGSLSIGDIGASGLQDNNQWVYALESLTNDGPWQVAEGFDKLNGLIKFTHGDDADGFSLLAMAYQADWLATDQIPQRLVQAGELGRYGSLDSSTGGDTHRYSLSLQQWRDVNERARLENSLYVIDYELQLTSNASYYSRDDLEDPARQGDQFTQFDDRQIYGGSTRLITELTQVHSLESAITWRYDAIDDVGIGYSESARIYDRVSRSRIDEQAAGLFTSIHSDWTPWLSTLVGGRYDYYAVDVDNLLADGSEGRAHDALISPKFSLRLGPWAETEWFINYGEGFHSNDARGVVADSDPVPLLSPSKGYELGLTSRLLEGVELSLVLFQLDLDSELIFVGDEGVTEANDATRRTGVELGVYYRPTDWLVLDLDYAKSRTRFRHQQYDGATLLGDHVPDSINDVFSLGASIDLASGWFGGLRLRYFGPRYLSEDGRIKSEATSVVNANLGYRFADSFSIGVEVLNVLDSEDDDITYWYASRTLAEREADIDPIEDFHSHPLEPRTARLTLAYHF